LLVPARDPPQIDTSHTGGTAFTLAALPHTPHPDIPMPLRTPERFAWNQGQDGPQAANAPSQRTPQEPQACARHTGRATASSPSAPDRRFSFTLYPSPELGNRPLAELPTGRAGHLPTPPRSYPPACLDPTGVGTHSHMPMPSPTPLNPRAGPPPPPLTQPNLFSTRYRPIAGPGLEPPYLPTV